MERNFPFFQQKTGVSNPVRAWLSNLKNCRVYPTENYVETYGKMYDRCKSGKNQPIFLKMSCYVEEVDTLPLNFLKAYTYPQKNHGQICLESVRGE
jgi:hypothetical protein